MIRKSEYFEQTDKYLDADLEKPGLSEFEIQLETDSDLADELKLHRDVEQAIGEHDVISLRENLTRIVHNQPDIESNCVLDSFSFGLSEESSTYKNLDHQIKTEDILNFGHSFPKIHLYQHSIAGKENIHQFYKEEFETGSVSDEESFTSFDEELFADIQDALEENDIFDIRANLKQIAQSMPSHQYSAEEIDDYIYNRMDPHQKAQFEDEVLLNNNLAKDLQLSREIDLASSESDIMELRASMRIIMNSESNSTVSTEDIESYIYNQLSEEELASFEAELSVNKDLVAEVGLVREIDLALKETEVMRLRSKLKAIAGDIASEKQTERSFAGKFTVKKILLSSVAASLILLIGITGLLSNQSSKDELYRNFHTTYQTSGISRSVSLTTDQALSMAMQKFDNQEYGTALNLLNDVVSRNKNNMVGHFYMGAALQETGRYQNAIREYETVIVDKDNLFTEQAEWYIGLCYLQTNEDKKAYRQFKKIANNEGFYQQKAQAILRKMKNS
jgi:tetratricopeptide (TPR) repeat protein